MGGIYPAASVECWAGVIGLRGCSPVRICVFGWGFAGAGMAILLLLRRYGYSPLFTSQ